MWVNRDVADLGPAPDPGTAAPANNDHSLRQSARPPSVPAPEGVGGVSQQLPEGPKECRSIGLRFTPLTMINGKTFSDSDLLSCNQIRCWDLA